MNKKNPSYIHFIIEANSKQTDTVFPYYEHVYNQKYPSHKNSHKMDYLLKYADDSLKIYVHQLHQFDQNYSCKFLDHLKPMESF